MRQKIKFKSNLNLFELRETGDVGRRWAADDPTATLFDTDSAFHVKNVWKEFKLLLYDSQKKSETEAQPKIQLKLGFSFLPMFRRLAKEAPI